jgi:hypothetical protein
LPVMPAFAALIALHWERLPLWGFRIALLLQLILLSALAWVGANLQLSNFLGNPGLWNYSPWHWAFLFISIVLLLLGIFNRDRSKTIALAGSFLCYCALTSSLGPLEGTLGRYQQPAIQAVAGKDVWVPCDYRAKDEEYRLLLPGAILHGYPAQDAGQIDLLSGAYPLVAVQSPIGSAPVLCDSCKIVGQRMEMRARHSDEEIQAILMGHIGEHLFVNEYLISTSASNPLPLIGKDACR